MTPHILGVDNRTIERLFHSRGPLSTELGQLSTVWVPGGLPGTPRYGRLQAVAGGKTLQNFFDGVEEAIQRFQPFWKSPACQPQSLACLQPGRLPGRRQNAYGQGPGYQQRPEDELRGSICQHGF